MNRSNIIKLALFFLVLYVFLGVRIVAQTKIDEYKLVAHSLDAVGGTGQSDDCLLRIGSGGQPGVIGTSQGTAFYGLQGYVNTAVFEHGDANADGDVTISDVVYMVNYLFKDGPEPIPLETGDVNSNNECSIADAVYLMNYLFKYGPAPCNL